MLGRKTKEKPERNPESLAKTVETLVAAMQQQQQQINAILNALGAGGGDDEGAEGEFGAGAEDNNGERAGGGGIKYPYGLRGDRTALELVKLCFNTPLNLLPTLTETPRMAVTPTAYVETLNEYIANMGNPDKYEPFDAIFIRKKDQRMKSVGRKSLGEALLFNQMEQEKRLTEGASEEGF